MSVNAFVELVRGAIGMILVPSVDYLALYKAEVKAASSDGKYLDVTPLDRRLPPKQRVPLSVGIPGATVIVQPGAIVMVGFEGGDPSQMYVASEWRNRATVVKVVLDAAEIYIGGESGAKSLITKDEFNNHKHQYNPGPGTATDSQVPTIPATGTSKLKAN